MQSKGLLRVFSNTAVQKHQFFGTQVFFLFQLSHPYMTTGKTIALTRRTFVGKVILLLFNMLSRLVRQDVKIISHLPGDLVAPCLLRLQVDLFGQALPSTPCLLLCLLQDSLEVQEDQACLNSQKACQYYHSGSFAGSVTALLSEEQTLHLNVIWNKA